MKKGEEEEENDFIAKFSYITSIIDTGFNSLKEQFVEHIKNLMRMEAMKKFSKNSLNNLTKNMVVL